jgi:cell division protein FtsL
MLGVDDKVTKLEKEVNEPNAKKEDYSNPIDILKRRLQKIVETNKEKRKLMDQYLRNVKVIEDSFD